MRVGIAETDPDPHGFMRFVPDNVYTLSIFRDKDHIEIVAMINRDKDGNIIAPSSSSSFIWLTETELCALMRQLYRQPTVHEGISGPLVHDLWRRWVAQIGRARYSEYVDGAFPDRLKPPDSGPILSKK